MNDVQATRPRRVLVFTGGDFLARDLDCLGDASVTVGVVCVDSGLMHCLGLGLSPTLLVGDMDSAPAEVIADPALASVPRLLFPADKDASDLELALHSLADDDFDDPCGLLPNGDRGDSRGLVPEEVIVVGVSGGRTDHLLFNWLLAGSRDWPFDLRFIDATVDAIVITSAHPLEKAAIKDATVSLLPLGQVVGVTTGGLRYALVDATLAAGGTLGLSNVVVESAVTVSVREGALLALFVR